jgi:hypothetical protein
MRRVRLMTTASTLHTRPWRDCCAFDQRLEPGTGILAIQLLGAKAVGPNDQHAVTRKTAPSELRQPNTDARGEAW